MADEQKTTNDSKVFDVAKPVKSGASITTSTKSASILKRSMMTTAPADSNTPAEETPETKDTAVTPDTPAPTSGKLKIGPISNLEDFKPSEEEKPEATEDAYDQSDDDDGTTEPDGRDPLKDASRDEQEVVDSKAAERQANYDKIVNAKTYFLPINQVVRRRSKHVVITGAILIVLLGLAWADVSLDAGLITIPGIEAPTHFFSK